MTPPTGRRAALGAVLVGVATLALLVATEPFLAIVWDEGYTLGREVRMRQWFRALADPAGFSRTWTPPAPNTELVQPDNPPRPAPRADQLDTRAELFSRPVLDWFWPFAREEPHGHPPAYAIGGLLGDLVTPNRPLLPRARLGPMAAFSLAAGLLWWTVVRRWGAWAAGAAVGAWVFQPNLFGNAHYATVDAWLASLWVLALGTFVEAVEVPTPAAGQPTRRSPRWGWVVAFGFVCGLAADSKLTGWFLPIPFLGASLLGRDRRGGLTLMVGGVVGVLTLYLLCPPLWGDVVGGLERFFRSNLTRARTIPIPVQFFGRIYNTPAESLPWYNTLAWLVLVTPVGLLALAGLGSFWTIRRGEQAEATPPGRWVRLGTLAGLHALMLLGLRALPHTPGHDGVRLILPLFGMVAVLVGAGAGWAVVRYGRVGRWLVGLAVTEAVVSVAVMMPVPLAYFSPVVGGLPGAARLGMEPTYFWDALDDTALDWLNQHTPAGRTVQFTTFPTSWLYLKQTGKLRAGLAQVDRGRPMWLVFQNRPGSLGPVERDLIENGTPALVVRKLGVPLVFVYPYPDSL